LRRMAAARLAEEKPGQTLQATALVHEAYLRLVGGEPEKPWDGRRHFFAAAAEAMRRILVENARRKKRLKHGGAMQQVGFDRIDPVLPTVDVPAEDLLALDEVLDRLAGEHAAAAEVVKLHFFAGLSLEDAGDVLGMSRASAYRLWTYARAWL